MVGASIIFDVIGNPLPGNSIQLLLLIQGASATVLDPSEFLLHDLVKESKLDEMKVRHVCFQSQVGVRESTYIHSSPNRPPHPILPVLR